MLDEFGNKLKYYCILNYFEFEKLKKNAKYQLLIDKEIYTEHKSLEKTKSFSCVYDSVEVKELYDYEYEFAFYFDFNNKSYIIKEEILDEYYDYLYLRIVQENFYCNLYDTCNEITNKIDLLIDIEKKKKVLIEFHDKYVLRYADYRVDVDYFNDQSFYFYNWKAFIKECFEEELYSYLTGKPINLKESSTVGFWIDVHYLSSVIVFCRKKLQEINDTLFKGNKPLFYHKVFHSIEAQNIFHSILLDENVIDSKNYPKYRFNTVVYNTFNCTNRFRDKLFRTGKLNTFVEFLEEKYHFEVNNKTKFGNKNDNLIARIDNLIQDKTKSSQNSN